MTEPVTASVRIAAPPEVVFPYFTDPALAVKWIADAAYLDARPGGTFALDVRGNPARGEYVVVEPPRRVVFTWGIEGRGDFPPGSSTVEVVLRADGDETVVTLTHRDLPDRGLPPLAPGGLGRVPRRPGDCGRLAACSVRPPGQAGSGGGPRIRGRAGPPKRERVTVLRSAALTWQGPQNAREAAPRCSSKRAPNSSSCAPSCASTTPSS